MPVIIFDKRKVSPLNIDFIEVKSRADADPERFGPSLPVVSVSAGPDSRQPVTVSARIHTFDDQLRCTLFAPNKAGTMSGAKAGTTPLPGKYQDEPLRSFER